MQSILLRSRWGLLLFVFASVAYSQTIPQKIEKYGACYNDPAIVKKASGKRTPNLRAYWADHEAQMMKIIKLSDDQAREFRAAAMDGSQSEQYRREATALAKDREEGSSVLRDMLREERNLVQKCLDGAAQALAAYNATQTNAGSAQSIALQRWMPALESMRCAIPAPSQSILNSSSNSASR